MHLSLSSAIHIVILASLFVFQPVYAQEKNVRIGVLTPLSGNAAFWGKQLRDGIYFAAKGEKHVSLFLEDSRYDNKTALSAYRKLRSADKIDILISMGGATCEVLNREAQRDKVIHIAVGCNTGKFNEADSYNFRLDVNEEATAEVLASYLQSRVTIHHVFWQQCANKGITSF